MHASIWKFAGDPDELLRRHDAMLEEIPRGRSYPDGGLR